MLLDIASLQWELLHRHCEHRINSLSGLQTVMCMYVVLCNNPKHFIYSYVVVRINAKLHTYTYVILFILIAKNKLFGMLRLMFIVCYGT